MHKKCHIKKVEKYGECVDLEDILFNETWRVKANDQVEARYALTPTVMKRIDNIRSIYKVDKISCSFFEDKILIAIYTTENQFEPVSFFRSTLDYDQIKDVNEQFYSVFALIEEIVGNKSYD